MSTAAVLCRWLCRNERHVAEGIFGRHGRYLPTVAWLMSKPSLSSSPWMRGAPHSGFAWLILQISLRISRAILGRPGGVIAAASRVGSPYDASQLQLPV